MNQKDFIAVDLQVAINRLRPHYLFGAHNGVVKNVRRAMFGRMSTHACLWFLRPKFSCGVKSDQNSKRWPWLEKGHTGAAQERTKPAQVRRFEYPSLALQDSAETKKSLQINGLAIDTRHGGVGGPGTRVEVPIYTYPLLYYFV